MGLCNEGWICDCCTSEKKLKVDVDDFKNAALPIPEGWSIIKGKNETTILCDECSQSLESCKGVVVHQCNNHNLTGTFFTEDELHVIATALVSYKPYEMFLATRYQEALVTLEQKLFGVK